MEIDESRRRPHADTEPDDDTPVCGVCGGAAWRPFDAVSLVPEYRARIINDVYCTPQCAYAHMAAHISPARHDLLAILRGRFAKYL